MGKKVKKTFGLYIDAEIVEGLEILAKKEKSNPSAILQRVMTRYVEKHKKEIEQQKVKEELKEKIDEGQITARMVSRILK